MRTTLGLIAAALITTAATANEPDGDKDRSRQAAEAKFESLDRNDDGQVSKSEARDDSKLSAQFTSADTNSDGYLTEPEYTAMATTDRPMPDYDRDPS
jgi:Ca2+-binding EF-hand superfamily protein